jgi:hypothetical protein
METFGDKLYNRTNEALDDVFEQGTIAQLTFQAFNKYIDLIKNSKVESIKIKTPIGYGADGKSLRHTNEYSKNELIESYEFLGSTQLPINGIYQLVTIVEALLCDIIRMILIQFPNKIPNKRKLDFELVLEANSLQEIKFSIVNIVINELSYKSPKEFAEEFEKYVGINLFESPAFHRYIELKATRDIYIHNQGIANEIYLSKSATLARVGKDEELPVNISYFMNSYESCIQIIELLESSLNKIWPSIEFQKDSNEDNEN